MPEKNEFQERRTSDAGSKRIKCVRGILATRMREPKKVDVSEESEERNHEWDTVEGFGTEVLKLIVDFACVTDYITPCWQCLAIDEA